MEETKSFAFVFLNEIIDLKPYDRIEILRGFILRKASDEHIDFIKRSIPYLGITIDDNPFEPKIKRGNLLGKSDTSGSKYSVIEFEIDAHTETSFEFLPPFFIEALTLSELKLDVIALFFYLFEKEENDYLLGFQHEQVKGYTLFTDTHRSYGTKAQVRKKPLKSQISEFRNVFGKLTELSSFNPDHFILKAAADYVKIKEISIHNPFRILSYFSVLELLITYPPKNSGDNSLSKQISKKTRLLINNYLPNIDFRKSFKGSDSNTIETIMYKLYTYRSDIAHGNVSDFEKDLKIIKDNDSHIQSFLDELTREVIRLGIEKPSLLSDVKNI